MAAKQDPSTSIRIPPAIRAELKSRLAKAGKTINGVCLDALLLAAGINADGTPRSQAIEERKPTQETEPQQFSSVIRIPSCHCPDGCKIAPRAEKIGQISEDEAEWVGCLTGILRAGDQEFAEAIKQNLKAFSRGLEALRRERASLPDRRIGGKGLHERVQDAIAGSEVTGESADRVAKQVEANRRTRPGTKKKTG